MEFNFIYRKFRIKNILFKLLLFSLLSVLVLIPVNLFGTFLTLIASIILLIFIPGYFILSFLDRKFNLIEVVSLVIVFGLAFQAIFSYFIDFLGIPYLNKFLFLFVGFVFLCLSKKIELKEITGKRKWLILLFLFLFSFSIFATPMKQVPKKAFKDIGPFPPGDDSKHHILLVKSFLNEKTIPNNYMLYPGIRTRYPMGYHSIISSLHFLSNINLYGLMFWFGIFMASFFVFSCYFLGKTIFNEKTGLIFAILSLGILPILKFVNYGMYPTLLGFVLHPFYFAFLYLYIKKGGKKNLILSAILLVSLFMINPYPFLASALPTLILIFFYRKKILKLLGLSLLLAIPYLFVIFKPISLGSSFTGNLYNLGFKHSFIGKKLEYFLYQKSYLLFNFSMIILGILGYSRIKDKKKRIILGTWILSIPIILLKRYIILPGNNIIWYYFNCFSFYLEDSRILYQLSVPIALLSSVFIQKMTKKKLYTLLVVIVLISYPLSLHFVRSNELSMRAYTEGDKNYIDWIDNNIPKNATIFNDYKSTTSSSWIPPLTNVEVTFPFLLHDAGILEGINSSSYLSNINTVRKIPNSKEALGVLDKYNATYVTFSTYFNEQLKKEANLPYIDEKDFKPPCYEKLYGKDENWVFKINYSCSPDNSIRFQTRDFVNEKFIVNKTNIRFQGGNRKRKYETGYTVKNKNILFNLENLYIDPTLKKKSELYLFTYYNSSRITEGKTKIKYGFEDKERFVSSKFKQYGSNKDLLNVFELPKYFLKERDPVVWYLNESIDLKNVSFVMNIPHVEKIGNGIYLQGSWNKSEGKYIIPKSSMNSRLLIKPRERSNLQIKFEDREWGNIDFNFYNESWNQYKIIDRYNTNRTIRENIRIPKNSKMISLNIIPHEEKFRINDINFKKYSPKSPNSINVKTFDFTEGNLISTEREVRFNENESQGKYPNGYTVKDQNILFDLGNLTMDPTLKEKSNLLLYTYYNSSRTTNEKTKIKYGLRDEERFVSDKFKQFETNRDLLHVFELPKYFLNEKNPVVWYLNGPIDIKNVTLSMWIPRLIEINEGIYLQGNWINKNGKYIVPKDSSNSRVILTPKKGQELNLRFKDNSKGNVDFNIYNGSWEGFTTIYRNNTDQIARKELKIPENIDLYGFNIKPHKSDFILEEINWSGVFER